MLENSIPLLPLTKVFIVDFEGLGLESRWNSALPLYFCGIITVDESGCKQIHRHFDAQEGINHARQLLENGWFMVAHNAKFELAVMGSRGFFHRVEKHKPSVGCTAVLEYTRNSGLSSYSLEELTGLKTDVVAIAQEKGLLDANINKKDFWTIDWSANAPMIRHIGDYCIDDCKATWVLYKRLCAWYNRENHEKFRSALFALEFPMLSVLAHMEQVGIHIDEEALQSLTDDCRATLATHKEQLDVVARFLPQLQWKAEEEEFVPKTKEFKKEVYKNVRNISYYMDAEGKVLATDPYIVSNHCDIVPYNPAAATGHTFWLIKQQCPEILERAELTPKGKPKLNKEFFSDVADDMPENLPIAKYLKATNNLQMCVSVAEHIRNGRIHGSFNNCLTRTGRLSSSSPNLQNIQRSDDNPQSVGSRFRQLFTAPDSTKCILVADLDRIEIVVLAWYLKVAMKDKDLAEVCNTPGSDPHQTNADRWGVKRSVAKTLIFLLVYGGGANLIFRRGMAETLELAEKMVEEVDKQQPSINKLKKNVWNKCRERGYITNPFNARGVYPELYSKRGWERGAGERKSFNFLIQRTARDILHSLAIDSLAVILKHGGRLVNIVHDEMIVECEVSVADTLMADLDLIWQNRWDILPGVKVNGDWGKGANWYEAK